MLYEISKLNKTYYINKETRFIAINDIDLTLPDTGFVSIIGKSGSGKSTLLNLLTLIDTPTSGKILYRNESILKLKGNKKRNYLNNDIGIVFQNYHLIDDTTVMYNICLPMLIQGKNKKTAENDAITLVKGIGLDKQLLNQKVNSLSGGEKQRVCILRSLINNPRVLFCDEPTGALDKDNSNKVMSILKKASQTKLVIVVSHNIELVTGYSDQIIEMSDGKIISNTFVNKNKHSINPKTRRSASHIKRDNWTLELVKTNIKKRWKRHIVSFLSISLCLIFTLLVSGFVCNSNNVISNESQKHLNIGVFTISKQTNRTVANSMISLVQERRPTFNEMNDLKSGLINYYTELNYDAILPTNVDISLKSFVLNNFSFFPVYSFANNYLNSSLLQKGSFPNNDTYLEVVINTKAYEKLCEECNVDVLNKRINVNTEYENIYYSFDENNAKIVDIFSFNHSLKIVGVVDELSFLSTPTIYYSFIGMDEYIASLKIENLSTHLGYSITWKDLIEGADATSPLTSYSYRMFPKNISNLSVEVKEPFVIDCYTQTINESLTNLIDASSKGVEIFLFVTLIGVLLIVGIISFSSYIDDLKRSAILSSLGASISEISKIYLYENYLFSSISLLFVLIIINPVCKGINKLIFNITGLHSVISIPQSIFKNYQINGSFYLFIILILFILITIATFLPIVLSKRISIKEELQEQ